MLAGVGQVLAGSLAYLVPVLMGPPLTVNLEKMTAHAWLPLVTANLGGVLVVAGLAEAAVPVFALWLVDFGRRVGSVVIGSRRGGDRRPPAG